VNNDKTLVKPELPASGVINAHRKSRDDRDAEITDATDVNVRSENLNLSSIPATIILKKFMNDE